MDRGPELKFFQRRCIDGQLEHEKMFSITIAGEYKSKEH